MLYRNYFKLVPVTVIFFILIIGLVTSCNKEEIPVFPINNNINPPPPPPPPPPPSPAPFAVAGPDIKMRNIGFMWLLGSCTQLSHFPATASWRKINGPGCIIERPDSFITKVSSFTTGIYQFELTARNSSGLTAKDTVTIEVEDLPARVVSWNNIPGLSGPFWDNLTLNLPAEAIGNVDYVMIRYVDGSGITYDWIPALLDYEPPTNGSSQRGYSYSFHSPPEIFIMGSVLVGEHYDVKIYY